MALNPASAGVGGLWTRSLPVTPPAQAEVSPVPTEQGTPPAALPPISRAFLGAAAELTLVLATFNHLY